MIDIATMHFLVDLSLNNSKQWFDEHRKEYDLAKLNFIEFVQHVIDMHGVNDKAIRDIKAKDCLFRINRDVRFSNNKSPYKTNFGASISMGGKKLCEMQDIIFTWNLTMHLWVEDCMVRMWTCLIL